MAEVVALVSAGAEIEVSRDRGRVEHPSAAARPGSVAGCPPSCAPAPPWSGAALVQLAGIVVIATGVALTIDAELGVAPYDVVTTGMHQRLGISLGLAAVLLPLVFLVAGAASLGGRVGLGTLVRRRAHRPAARACILAVLPEVHALAVRIPMYAAGFSCITVGIGLVIVPDLGAGPGRGAHARRGGKGIRLAGARTGIEAVLVLVGWAHAGPGRRRHRSSSPCSSVRPCAAPSPGSGSPPTRRPPAATPRRPGA